MRLSFPYHRWGVATRKAAARQFRCRPRRDTAGGAMRWYRCRSPCDEVAGSRARGPRLERDVSFREPRASRCLARRGASGGPSQHQPRAKPHPLTRKPESTCGDPSGRPNLWTSSNEWFYVKMLLLDVDPFLHVAICVENGTEMDPQVRLHMTRRQVLE